MIVAVVIGTKRVMVTKGVLDMVINGGGGMVDKGVQLIQGFAL